LRHLHNLRVSNSEKYIGCTRENETVVVFGDLTIVVDVLTRFLLSIPKGNLVEVFEIPNPLLANAFE
jgi:hypothetical protein